MAENKSSLFSSIKTILSLKPKSEDQERLLMKGVPNSKINNGTVIMESLVDKASKGEVAAIKEIMAILQSQPDENRQSLSKLYKALENDEN